MTQGPEHRISEEILAKYFEGNASAEEMGLVKAWASQSAGHARDLEAYRMAWRDTGVIKNLDKLDVDVDLDKAWQSIRLKKNQLDAVQPTIQWYQQSWLRVAAVLTIAFGLSWVSYLNFFKTQELTLASAETLLDASLPDGSNVTLNAHSTITYPSKFDSDVRSVNLQGEAFFDVEHDPEQPFEVEMEEVSVRVLGTSFNISSFSDRDTTLVSVLTGRVLFYTSTQEEVLTAGMTGSYDRRSGLITVRKDQVADIQHFWRTKRLSFSGTSLEEIVRSLNQVYNLPVSLGNPALSNCTLTVTFEDESLEDVIDIIATTLNLQVTTTDEGIILDGDGC